MNLFVRLFIILLVILPAACNKKQELVDPIKDTSLDLQMIEAYKKGLEELENGQALIAAKKFNEAEILFPQSQWAPRSALMSAYSYFDYGFYLESIDEVNRFLKTYPTSDRKNYAHYLKAMSYYNQIVDEKKDLGPIIEAKESFQLIISQYPNSEYAMDAEFKLELIEEILAAIEMHRKEGHEIGFIDIKLLEPFPTEHVKSLLKDSSVIVDRKSTRLNSSHT